VAQEHYCTAATQLIMSQLSPRLFGRDRIGRRLVVTCVGDELYELGMHMVADFFEMEGWDAYMGHSAFRSRIWSRARKPVATLGYSW
jgi:methanogenic corrinoid protein MtbC1